MGLKFGVGIYKYMVGLDQDWSFKVGEGEILCDYFVLLFYCFDEYIVDDVVICVYIFILDEYFFCISEDRVIIVFVCFGYGYKFGVVVGQKLVDGFVFGNMYVVWVWFEVWD